MCNQLAGMLELFLLNKCLEMKINAYFFVEIFLKN